MVPHIHTNDGITVVLNNQPYHAAKSDEIYKKIVELVNANYRAEDIKQVFEAAAAKIKKAVVFTPNLEYNGGVVLYKGEVLGNYAVDKLLALIDAGLDAKPLARFIDNLMQNPSKRVVDDLYRFLEKGRIPITEDGHFLAYKKVRGNYKDIHSGKFDNSIGSHHEMPRNQVDEDPNRTCSTGFHVCSYDYLPQFGSSDGNRVVVCKVNPADVVAIPSDYNDTKMRVYKYVVTDEVTDYFKKGDDVLTKQQVSAERRDFEVWGREYFDSSADCLGTFWTEQEAAAVAADYFQGGNGDFAEITVYKISAGKDVVKLG